MQILPETDAAQLLQRLVQEQVPGRRGLAAWHSMLRAHATLIRRLDTDLQQATGLALADFDVLAQLAEAHGELRMTELADRALISRSGMSRRVARLVDEGLIRRDRARPRPRDRNAVRRPTRRSGARPPRARPEQGHRRLLLWLRPKSP